MRYVQPKRYAPLGRDVRRHHARARFLRGDPRYARGEHEAEHQNYWPQKHRGTEGIDSTDAAKRRPSAGYAGHPSNRFVPSLSSARSLLRVSVSLWSTLLLCGHDADHSDGGRNFTHAGDGADANTPDGFSRPFPASMRHTSTVSEF